MAVAVFGSSDIGWWSMWAGAAGGLLAVVVGAAAWRFPLLRVTTADGTAEYEVHDGAADAEVFAATIRLAAGV